MHPIERLTQFTERQAPLLAFRRYTFNLGMTTEQAAKVMLGSAKELGLIERDHFYGNTLNAWLLPDGKPPMWSLMGAMYWLESNGWQPSVEHESSDYAWWAYCKSKRFDTYEAAVETIPTNWPQAVRDEASAWLHQVMLAKATRQQMRAVEQA